MSPVTSLNKINSILKKANFVISFLLLVVFFCVLLVHLNQEIRDLDIWLHIKAGEQIILNKGVPLVDIFSFSKENQIWINHEWLFQVLASIAYKYFGFDGLIVLQNVVFMVIFFILFNIGYRKRNFLFLSTILFIFLLNSSYRFTIRPDMFSVLFLVLFIFILKEKKKYIYTLPFLQIVWTNFHGFFFIGPLIILIFALTEKSAQRDKKLWKVFFFSLFATIINPQLIRGAVYPIMATFSLSKDSFVLNSVLEMQRPFLSFRSLINFKDWFFYKSLIIISIFSFRLNQKKFNLTLFSLWVTFLIFSLFAIRNIIYFSVIAIIAIFYNAKERFSYDANFSNEKFSTHKYYYLGRLFLISSLCFSMLSNARQITNYRYFDFDNYNFKSGLWGINLRNYPKKAVDFLISQDFPARMYNDFNSGSYIIGRTYPKRKVFIDGRTEFYGNNFLREYKKASDGDIEAIKNLITKYDLEGFILTMAMSNFDGKLAKHLFESRDWKAIYFDESAIIFLKNIPKNKKFIDKYYIDFKSWVPPKAELIKIGPRIVYPYPYIKRARALKEMGCLYAAASEAKEALKIEPNCADAYQLLGNCYDELKEYGLALENYRIAVALLPYALDLRNSFALVLYRLGYLNEAKSQLAIILKSRPKDATIYHAFYLIYKKQGKFKKAEEMIRKANQLSKNRETNYLSLWANILFELKDYKQSLKIYRELQSLAPLNVQIKKNIENIEKIL